MASLPGSCEPGSSRRRIPRTPRLPPRTFPALRTAPRNTAARNTAARLQRSPATSPAQYLACEGRVATTGAQSRRPPVGRGREEFKPTRPIPLRDLDRRRLRVLAGLVGVEVLRLDLRVVGAVLRLTAREDDLELPAVVGRVLAKRAPVAVVLADQLHLALLYALALGRVDRARERALVGVPLELELDDGGHVLRGGGIGLAGAERNHADRENRTQSLVHHNLLAWIAGGSVLEPYRDPGLSQVLLGVARPKRTESAPALALFPSLGGRGSGLASFRGL